MERRIIQVLSCDVNRPFLEGFIGEERARQVAMQLIELGFEYVTGEYGDGGKLFKKRKQLYLGSSSEGL